MDNLNLISVSIEEEEKLTDSTTFCDSSCTEEDVLGSQTDDTDEKYAPLVKELAGPTKRCSRSRQVREIFPWLPDIYKSLRLNSNSEQAQKNVVPIMENYLRFINEDLNKCLRYPNRCFILSKNITKMLILFKDINKNFDDSHDYLMKVCDLLRIYTTLELRYSTKFEESKILVANRIALNYEVHLQSIDKAYILRIFISIKNFFQQKEIMCKLFEKYLKHKRYTQQELEDKLYVMYLIAFKYWRSLEEEVGDKFKIDDMANSFMRPSPTLRVNLYYAPFIPPYKTNENATKFILAQHFNPSVLAKAIIREELCNNEDLFTEKIIDLSLNEQPINKNHINTAENSLRSNFKLSSVKLEKQVVVAVIDLTAEDQAKKCELSWLSNLIQRARSAEPISILGGALTNVPSKVIEIIDLDEDEDIVMNEDVDNKKVESQISETDILLEESSLNAIEIEDNYNDISPSISESSSSNSKEVSSRDNEAPDNNNDNNEISLTLNQSPENNNKMPSIIPPTKNETSDRNNEISSGISQNTGNNNQIPSTISSTKNETSDSINEIALGICQSKENNNQTPSIISSTKNETVDGNEIPLGITQSVESNNQTSPIIENKMESETLDNNEISSRISPIPENNNKIPSIIYSTENETSNYNNEISITASQTPEYNNEKHLRIITASDNLELPLHLNPDKSHTEPIILFADPDNDKIVPNENVSDQIQEDTANTKNICHEPIMETGNNEQQNNIEIENEIVMEPINNNTNKSSLNQSSLTEVEIGVDKGATGSLHTILNILSDKISGNDLLNENNASNKIHHESSEEFTIDNETTENERSAVTEDQDETETDTYSSDKDKSEQSLFMEDRRSVVLNLKTYSNRNRESCKTKSISCTSANNTSNKEIGFSSILEKKSDTITIDMPEVCDRSTNYIPFSEIALNSEPPITPYLKDNSSGSSEIKMIVDELVHITENISTSETPSDLASLPNTNNDKLENNTSSPKTSLNLINSTESIITEDSDDYDDDDIIKNIAKSLTMNPQKTYQRKKKPVLPSINTINIPPMKETAILDLPAFSSSSSDFNDDSRDSNLLSILDESDHLDDENLDLNRSEMKDIDDIPIDKISPNKTNVRTMKSPTAGNVIFSITTSARSVLPPSKAHEVKAPPKNSNVVFSTQVPIPRTENLVAANKNNLNDNWIDPVSEFEDNALSIQQIEIVSPPIEEFTKSDKTLFKTYLNKTDVLPSKTVSFEDGSAEKNFFTETKTIEKERDSVDKPKSITTFTIEDHLQQETVDDNFINVLPNIQKRKSVSFLDVPQEKSAQPLNRPYSNLNCGMLNKINYKPTTKLSGKECWASAINTYNSKIDIPQHKPPLSPPPHSICSSINMKTTRPTLRTSDPENRRRLNKNFNNDEKIFKAFVRVSRIDRKLSKPICATIDKRTEEQLEIQRKKENIKKTLNDFDQYIMQKKLENYNKLNIQLDSWPSNKYTKDIYRRERVPSPKKRRRSMSQINSSKGHSERLPKISNESRQVRCNKRLFMNSNHNVRRLDHKLQKKVVVELEDITTNSKYQQYFSAQTSLSKDSNFLNKTFDNISGKDLLQASNVKYNFRAHLVQKEKFPITQVKTKIAATVSRQRRNTTAPEIVVHVFNDSPIENNKCRSSLSNCSDMDITETYLKKFADSRSKNAQDTHRKNINDSNISEISTADSGNIPHNLLLCKTISGNDELVRDMVVQENSLKDIPSPSEHCNEELSILKPNVSETNALSIKESSRSINDDINIGPVPYIDINPNHPPEPDKHLSQSIDEDKQVMFLGNWKNSNAQIANKDVSNLLNEPSCSTEIITNANSSINNSCSAVSVSRVSNENNSAFENNRKSIDCNNHVQHRDAENVPKMHLTEPDRDNEVTSTQGYNTRAPVSACDIPSTNISLSEIDVQNDQVDTSNLVDTVISRNMNRGRRKSVAFDVSGSHLSYLEEWPKRRKTICEETVHDKESTRLDDMINIPSTTTTIDPPRKKRGRPKGSKNKLKSTTEATSNIVPLVQKYGRNKKKKPNENTNTKRTKDDIMSVSSITSTSSRDSDNEPLTKIQERLAQANASISHIHRAESNSPEDLNVNLDIAKTYSKNNFIKNVFVPPEIEKIIEAEENVKSDCINSNINQQRLS